jgi:urease accessory protein
MNLANPTPDPINQRRLTSAATDLGAWLPQLLQTNDSVFPSGSYAHSFGLESLVQLGMVTDRDSLAALLKEHLIPMFQHVDLPFVRLAHEAVSVPSPLRGERARVRGFTTHSEPEDPLTPALSPGGGEGDCAKATAARLLALDELCTALKGSSELRQAGSRIGSQRLAMLLQISPDALLTALDQARLGGTFQAQAPIIHGVQTALSNTPLEAALLSYFYQSLAAIISAAMKLIRLGQIGAQSLLTECLQLAPRVITASTEIAEDDIGWFSPALDIASARHETAYTRIFIS